MQKYTSGAWLGSYLSAANTQSPYTSTANTGITTATIGGDYILGTISGTDWYMKTAGNNNVDDITNWTQDASGATSVGTLSTFAPAGGTNYIFHIQNKANPTLSSSLTIGGGGGSVVLIVGDGTNAVNFNIPSGSPLSNATAPINVSANATLTLTDATFPTFGTLNATSTVAFAGASQTAPAITYGSLTFSGSGTATMAGATTVQNNFSVTSGSVTAPSGNLSIGGNWNKSAIAAFTPNNGTVIFNGTGGSQTISTINQLSFYNLTINNPAGVSSIPATSNIVINGNMAFTSGKFAIGSIVLFLYGTVSGMTTGAAGNNIAGSTTATIQFGNTTPLGTLIMDPTNAGTQTLKALYLVGSSSVTLGSPVTLGIGTAAAGLSLNPGNTLNDGGNLITCNGNATVAGTESGTGGITMNTAGTNVSGNIQNLTINPGAGNSINMSSGLSITGTLAFASGRLALGGNTLTFNSGASVSGMTRNTGTGANITGDANAVITLSNTSALGTIVMDETNATTQTVKQFQMIGGGSVTLGSPLTVNTTLQLTSGIVNTGANAITTTATAVSGGGSTSYVNGMLIKTSTTSSAINYEVGDGLGYAPMLLTPSGTITAGGLE